MFNASKQEQTRLIREKETRFIIFHIKYFLFNVIFSVFASRVITARSAECLALFRMPVWTAPCSPCPPTHSETDRDELYPPSLLTTSLISWRLVSTIFIPWWTCSSSRSQTSPTLAPRTHSDSGGNLTNFL